MCQKSYLFLYRDYKYILKNGDLYYKIKKNSEEDHTGNYVFKVSLRLDSDLKIKSIFDFKEIKNLVILLSWIHIR